MRSSYVAEVSCRVEVGDMAFLQQSDRSRVPLRFSFEEYGPGAPHDPNTLRPACKSLSGGDLKQMLKHMKILEKLFAVAFLLVESTDILSPDSCFLSTCLLLAIDFIV
jgi:hypothetical protein